MRAIQFDHFGPANEVLHLVDIPRPVRQRGELLIKVVSTSVNPVDWKTRSGHVPSILVKLPKVPGGDVAGIVVECDECSSFKLNERVFACTDGFKMWKQNGCYCEFVSVPEDQVAVVPENVSLRHAGGLPLVSLTAWQALETINLQKGQTLLLQGGAGGVGSMCIQLAKARGLFVITTCSERNVQRCKDLGADLCIAYDKEDFVRIIDDRQIDGVIDLIGGEVEIASLRLIESSTNPKAPFCSVLNSGFARTHGKIGATFLMLRSLISGKIKNVFGYGSYSLLLVQPSGKQLLEIAKLLAADRIRPVIDHELPLEKAAEGHEYLEQGHAHGKVILTVADESS